MGKVNEKRKTEKTNRIKTTVVEPVSSESQGLTQQESPNTINLIKKPDNPIGEYDYQNTNITSIHEDTYVRSPEKNMTYDLHNPIGGYDNQNADALNASYFFNNFTSLFVRIGHLLFDRNNKENYNYFNEDGDDNTDEGEYYYIDGEDYYTDEVGGRMGLSEQLDILVNRQRPTSSKKHFPKEQLHELPCNSTHGELQNLPNELYNVLNKSTYERRSRHSTHEPHNVSQIKTIEGKHRRNP